MGIFIFPYLSIKMYKGNKIIVIIPAYNEEGKIGNTINKIKNSRVDNILVVNDGSTDGTRKEIEKYKTTHKVILINFESNKGLGMAFKTAFEYTIRHNYNIGAIMAGDDQDDPDRLDDMIETIVDRGYDIVHGSRYLGGLREKVPLFRKLTTKMFTLLFSFAAMRKVTDASTGFKAFKVEILKTIDFSPEWLEDRYGIETYFSLMAIKKGYKFTEVPVRKFYHETGYSKMRPGIDYWYNVKPILKCILK